MKTILLSALFIFGCYTSQACSCFYISDYFCPSVSWVNANGGNNDQIIVLVKVTDIYGYYMDVQVVENLQNAIQETELTILGQDGLNCNEWLEPFEVNKTFILAIYESGWEEGVYDLSGCGRFWLPVINDMVQGNISEGLQEQDYETFKQNLAECIGLTSTESPDLERLKLFPNPTSGDLYLHGLEVGEILDYRLYSLTGQLLHAGQIDSSSSPILSLAGLPRGLYLLRLQDGKAVLTRRIILEKD